MLRQWLGVLITAPSIAGLAIAVNALGWFQMLEWATLDRYFRLRPPEPIDSRIAIVTIDESDIQKIGTWPIPDAVLAQVINNLKAQQPKAIGLDLYRDLPVPPGSEELNQAFESTPYLIGVEKEVAEQVGPPPTLDRSNRVALADLVLDADGKVRRGLMSIKSDNGETKLSLGARLSLMYLESKGITPQAVDGNKLSLGKAVFRQLTENDGGYVGVDAGGYQVLLNFRGPQDRFHTISITDVLENRIHLGGENATAPLRDNADAPLRDRIVLIGATGQSLNDLFMTPYSSHLFSISERTPGVVIHANLISQTLSAALDGRPLIRVWTEPLEGLWIVFWSGCGATLALVFVRRRWAILYLFLIGLGLIGSSYLAFLLGWWLPIVAPFVALVSAAGMNASYILIQNLQLSHKQLEEYSQKLEEKVKERTLELELQAIELDRAKEIAISASAAKSLFLASMSHELRTPLNAILGFTQLMARTSSLNAENQDYIRIINRSGEHLLSLINDILDISKIEAGRVELNENTFDLYHLLDTLKDMLQLKAESKSLELRLERDREVPQYVKTDENKLRQILINLLGNAIKFTQIGYVKLGVKARAKSKDEKNLIWHLKFEVEDTGAGIAANEIERLFETFVQTQSGLQSGEGTGLGLPISRKFVQLMGGDIMVKSVVGEGTTFTFEIPITLADKTEVPRLETTQQIIGLEPDQPTYRILVAEELQENRQLLMKLLTSVGFEVREASDERDAIALWESWKPHLIWMGWRFSKSDECHLVQRLKATSQTPKPAVIALTASAFEDEQNLILSAGFDDVVSKPFQAQVIFETMAKYLGVRYLYEGATEDSSLGKTIHAESRSTASTLQAVNLDLMPLEWVDRLDRSASQCDDFQIYQLIEEIPDSKAELANALTCLIYDYRFDQIIELTQAKLLSEPQLENVLEEKLTKIQAEQNPIDKLEEREAAQGNILIVDDTLENVRILSTLLKQQGYDIQSVNHGIDALAIAQIFPLDLILLDINMPDLDGYQVCQKLKAQYNTKDIPVIFISALDRAIDKVKAFEVGGVDYITKPFHLEEVLARVKNQLILNQLQKKLIEQNIHLQQEICDRLSAEELLRQSEAQEREKSQQLAQALQQLAQAQSQLVQREKMSSLGHLVAGIAHEINNPVNFIYGNLKYLQAYYQDLIELVKLYRQYQPNPSAEIQAKIVDIDLDFIASDSTGLLNSIEAGTQRIIEIVELLRIFSHLDKSEIKAVNIHAGIDSTLAVLAHRLQAQPHLSAIEVIKEYGNLPKIECYAGQLNQVFLNLMSNAIDALEERRRKSSRINPQIHIRTEVLNQQRIAIYITDNGIGISEAVQQRLFDPFFTTKEVGKGTGLGLSISYQIAVDKHGGEIRCISAPGQGATFVVELPIEQVALKG